jgi:hypothetical protein
VGDQHEAVAEVQKLILSTPLYALDVPAGERGGVLVAQCASDRGVIGADGGESLADRRSLQSTRRVFNFR